MELKKQLNHYDEREFSAFVHAIWNVEVDQSHHDTLIAHFDKIVGHPSGSDLLFYSEAERTGSINSPDEIVETIKSWHRRNGRAAFKGQAAPPAPPARQTLTREQRADQTAKRNLDRVRKLAAEIQAGERDFKHKATLLERALSQGPVAGIPAQQLAAAASGLRVLEAAQHQAKQALGTLERLQMSVKFTLDAAKRDVKSPFSNPAIQAVVLREMTTASQQHGAALAAALTRHPPLYKRGAALIERLAAQIAQLAKATKSGPGHGTLTLNASAHVASLYPQLLTAQGLKRETAESQRGLIKTLRSAVAELEWQGTSVQGEHPGSYADVLEFVLSTPSDDPRFAFTVPLTAISELEHLDWAALAASRGQVSMPMRLCSKVKGTSTGSVTGIKPWTRYSHVVMTSTQGSVVPSQVRVRAARWDASRKSFAFTSEGEAPVTITWQTMRAAYADQDTSRPASVGYLRIPEVPLIEKFPALRDVLFDDYIVVFPEGSGMSPLYLMFRDRREL